jgi:PhnB protein
VHVSLPIGKSNTLMATYAMESMGHKLTGGNNFHLSIETENKEEAERIYKELSARGKEMLLLADTFWGAHFGTVNDKFGIQWMVNCT